MANPEHEAKLREALDAGDIDIWNKWREEIQPFLPDLKSAELIEANLQSANLFLTNLQSANLYGANLLFTNLYGANLQSADLSESQYEKANFWGIPEVKHKEIQLINNITSLSDFLTNKDTQALIRYNQSVIQIYFRGESDSGYDLVPVIARKDAHIQNEAQIMTDMQTRNPAAFQHKSHFGKMVTARHHGLPNRLLDVTRNPLVALFNAINGNENKDGHVHIFVPAPQMIKPFHSDTISMLANFTRLSYVEQRSILGKRGYYQFPQAREKLLSYIREEKPHFEERFNYGDFLRPFIVEPERSIDRVKAQSGAFIISALHNRYERDQILDINPHIPCYGHAKFIIPAKAKETIRKELEMLGVTEETLMADLDSSAKAIMSRYT